MELNVVDTIIGIVMVGSAILGLYRGLIKEVLSLVTWALAIFMSITYSSTAYLYLAPYITNTAILAGVAFASVFFVVLIAGSLIILAINKVLTFSGLGLVNRMMGAVFGVGRGVLLIVVGIMVLQSTSLAKDLWWKSSQLVPKFKPLVEYTRQNTKSYRVAAAALVYSNVA